jgi:hypothetical protein
MRCKVCSSKHREAVESELVAGASLRDIARRYHLTKDCISRHAKSCVQQQLERRAEARGFQLGDRLLEEMDELHAATRALLKRATDEQDFRVALRAIGEARRNLALVARMVGSLDPKQDKKDGLVTWEEFVLLYRQREAHT